MSDPFSQNVQKMVHLEKEMQQLQERMKQLKQEKQNTQDYLTRTMVERQWQQRKIQVGSYDMSMADRKQYSSLTFGYLEEMLPKLIPDKTQVDYVVKYLKDNRTVKTVPEIRFIARKVDSA